MSTSCIFIIIILSIALAFATFYVIMLKVQFKGINRILIKRFTEDTREPITLSLFDRELNKLSKNINKALKKEEDLKIRSIREEKHFKELIANISHDLRTPLTALKGYQQLMGQDELSDKQRERLNIAQAHAEKLENLIEHFFEYSYLITSDITPNFQQVNATNFVAQCIMDSVQIIESNNISINFIENPPVFIMADKDMLSRVVQNLIRNSAIHSGGDIEVSVKNYGNDMGEIYFMNPIKPNTNVDIDRVFERFYTEDKSRKTGGLGLSIVKLLTEQMKGEVSAELIGGNIKISVKLPLDKNKNLIKGK